MRMCRTAMSTFSLVLQLWFTLSNALLPPKVAKQRDCFRNVYVSLSLSVSVSKPALLGISPPPSRPVAPAGALCGLARVYHRHPCGTCHSNVNVPKRAPSHLGNTARWGRGGRRLSSAQAPSCTARSRAVSRESHIHRSSSLEQQSLTVSCAGATSRPSSPQRSSSSWSGSIVRPYPFPHIHAALNAAPQPPSPLAAQCTSARCCTRTGARCAGRTARARSRSRSSCASRSSASCASSASAARWSSSRTCPTLRGTSSSR